MKLILGDCLEKMAELPTGTIDAVICDPPYGTTACKWDSMVSLEIMWAEIMRLTKPDAAIALFTQQPFTSKVVMSMPKLFRYEWIWEKPQGTGHLNAKKYPLKNHENVAVFSKTPHKYNPQFDQGKPYKCFTGSLASVYGKHHKVETVSDGRRYPKTVLKFKKDKIKVHPTQKPVALLEYLVKTYTNPGDIVLDFTMGSGTTGVACKNTGRLFIGIEKDEAYFEIAKKRIADAQPPQDQPQRSLDLEGA